ncbi:MAG: hypothetical protein U0V70_15630 [Terriglobia bacterium]
MMQSAVQTRGAHSRNCPRIAMVVWGLCMVLGLTREGVAQNQLNFFNNYFVTGDYVVGGVGLRGLGVKGYATGTINIPDATYPGAASSVPPGADIVAALLYWQTVESSKTSFAGQQGYFRGYPITGTVLGNPNAPVSWSSGGCNGSSYGSKTMRTYRADVRPYLQVDTKGSVVANTSYQVQLADSGSTGSGAPLTLGATLVLIYRVLDKNVPLNAITIYDGAFAPSNCGDSLNQTLQGFYQPTQPPGGIVAKLTHIVGNGQSNKKEQVLFNGIALSPAKTAAFPGRYNGSWDNPTWNVSPYLGPADTSATSTVIPSSSNSGCVSWGAIVLSTTVQNSDNDGLLDIWKTNSGYCSASVNEGVCTPGDASWVSLPGAILGQKDVFVQLDYMYQCNAINPDGTCSSNGASLLPNSQVLSMVSSAFTAHQINLHVDIKNVVPAQACVDDLTASPPAYCSFPNQPGVVGWKGGFEFIKTQPLNYPDEISCQQALNGPCVRRFQPGRKDSYHYALFGIGVGMPNWTFQAGTLLSITGSGNIATFATSTKHGLAVGDRITVSDAISNPNLSGIYFIQSVPDPNTFTIQFANPSGVAYAYNQTTDPDLSVASSKATSASGLSDVGGADSLITLGLWGADGLTTQVQAGTLMHELGHALALTHGGYFFDSPGSYVPTVEPNCKPNYQSVMNYLFQVDMLGPDGVLDFSSQQLATLNENSLAPGVSTADGSPIKFTTTKWYDANPSGGVGSPANCHCDGTPISPLTDVNPTMYLYGGPTPPPANSSSTIPISWSSASLDANFDGKLNASPALRGYNDWSNIDLRQIGATGSDIAGSGRLLNGGGRLLNGGGRLLNGGGRLLNGGGMGSGEISFQTANSVVRPPRNLTATATPTPRQIQLSWTPPSFGQVTAYNIYRAVNGVPIAPPYATISGNPPATISIDTAITCGPTYTYFVTAILSDGRESAPSNSASLQASCPVYNFAGFFSPLSTAGDNSYSGIFTLCKTIAAKWTLKDSGGNYVNNLKVNTLLAFGPTPPLSNGTCPVPRNFPGNAVRTILYSPQTGAKSKSTFGYSTPAQQFIFNWDTNPFGSGCYLLELDLDTGQVEKTSLRLK